MQIKFVSPYKLIFFFGICGIIISLISSLVAYSIDYEDNLINYFSELKSVLDKGKTYKFYGEIFLVYPVYVFSNFMEFTFEMLTIYYLNPFYILMTNTLYYGISELIFYMLNLSGDGLVITHFLLTELTEIVICLGLMVYLEIIELNFCGLNQRTERFIRERELDRLNNLIGGLESASSSLSTGSNSGGNIDIINNNNNQDQGHEIILNDDLLNLDIFDNNYNNNILLDKDEIDNEILLDDKKEDEVDKGEVNLEKIFDDD
jgi:hypothetical protein